MMSLATPTVTPTRKICLLLNLQKRLISVRKYPLLESLHSSPVLAFIYFSIIIIRIHGILSIGIRGLGGSLSRDLCLELRQGNLVLLNNFVCGRKLELLAK